MQIGLNQINLDQIGSNWIKLYIIGFNEINWTKLDQTGSKREQIGSNQLKLDQIWSPWFSKKKNLGGKLTIKSCTLWSNWIKLELIDLPKFEGGGLSPTPAISFVLLSLIIEKLGLHFMVGTCSSLLFFSSEIFIEMTVHTSKLFVKMGPNWNYLFRLSHLWSKFLVILAGMLVGDLLQVL